MPNYRVNLDIFAGPMDLLLYLVRKEEVDIYDIPIARITDQYLHYIEVLKSLDIDLAGDFLVMAATLMEIKSAMLLPRAQPEEMQEEDWTDPRTELVRQLLEYKKYKDAANLLNAAADRHSERFPRPDYIIEQLKPADEEAQIDMDQVSIWDLLEAFDAICKATGRVQDISHIKDDTPVDLYQIEVLHRLQTEGPMTFERLFDAGSNRVVMVGLFLALLELIREKLVWAEQPGSSGEIYIRPLTEKNAEEAVREAILAVSEPGRESAETERDKKQPPIPITQLPHKSKPSASPEKHEKIESDKSYTQEKTT